MDLDCPGEVACVEGFCALSPSVVSEDADAGDVGGPATGDVGDEPDELLDVAEDTSSPDSAVDVLEDVMEPDGEVPPPDGSPDDPLDEPGLNACGGQAELNGVPGEACDACRGVFVCDGEDALRCETDLPTDGALVVDTLEDMNNGQQRCSLREAVRSANERRAIGGCDAPVGEARILLSLSGSYALNRLGRVENEGLTGDLDVLSVMSVEACQEGATIDGLGEDRIFHVRGRESQLTLVGVTLRQGEARGDDAVLSQGGSVGGVGGAIFNEGTLVLRGVVLRNNAAIGGDGADGVLDGDNGGGGGGGGGGGLGGALFNNGGAVTLEDVAFRDNEAIGGRGGEGVINNGLYIGDGGGGGSVGGDGGRGNGVGSIGGLGSFGGGGGGGGATNSGSGGGDAGFGGGGGGGGARTAGGNTGPGGVSPFAGGLGGQGCCSAGGGGGGGGGLGGALFNLNGSVIASDVLFERNTALGGLAGLNAFGAGTAPLDGLGVGGAVFEVGSVSDFSQARFEDNGADQDVDVGLR